MQELHQSGSNFYEKVDYDHCSNKKIGLCNRLYKNICGRNVEGREKPIEKELVLENDWSIGGP